MSITAILTCIISPDGLGLIGVLLTLIAYLLLNIEKLLPDHISYALLNITGSGLILYSLFFNWNLAAVAMEVSWLLISFYGLYNAIRHRVIKKNS